MSVMVPSAVSYDADVRASVARDASGLVLVPEGVARPATREEACAVLAEAAATRTPVTCAGGQSSTTGASITDRGLLLSLRGLARVLDVDDRTRIARVEPGVLLSDLNRALAPAGLHFAPDPTSEWECTIGGAIACNASGARSLRYGATRPHVRALTVQLITGETLTLRRPQLEKNTVGYAFAHDPVDWFIGSEGTLGVVLEAELALTPLPQQVLGLAIPFRTEADALTFVAAARDDRALDPRCLEYFDALALEIARDAEGTAGWASGATAMVYTEDARDEGEPPLEAWLALAESLGASTDDIRVYDGEGPLAEARRVRHAVPATMNERGARCRAAGGRKVSTDWAVPYRRLGEMLAQARGYADEAGVAQAVTYGHAGNGHPHQNFIARDADELRRIEAVVERTLRTVLTMGGTVAAEHGIGKLKAKWLPLQMDAVQQRAMRALKQALDPHGLLAPGNVFPLA
ncbi:MAG: FAD-binding oxidoreductase [Gemmatimonadaceae bacterium]|nr:FAD-binding oxidoreductase [Gemmatimonadaceae bacterium]